MHVMILVGSFGGILEVGQQDKMKILALCLYLVPGKLDQLVVPKGYRIAEE